MLAKYLKMAAMGFTLSMIHLTPNAEYYPFIAEKMIVQRKEKDTDRYDNEKRNSMKCEFPQLTGNYNVGLTSRHVVDFQRKDMYDPLSYRELMVMMWYPAHETSSNNKSELEIYCKEEAEALKKSFKQMGLSKKDILMIDQVYVHAISEAKPLRESKPFPIILFSHGYLGCDAKMYTVFCEELASHGYIVASIAHTHYATKVRFPDGRIISPAPEKLNQQARPSAQEQKLWIEDVQTALNHLEACNKNSEDALYNAMDIQRIGVVGHSMGGVAAYNLCLEDNRFIAGINFDEFSMINNSVADMKRPFMFILAQDTIDNLYATDEELVERTGLPIEQIVHMRNANQAMFVNMKKYYQELQKTETMESVLIPGIKHSGFSDLMILKEFFFYKNNKNIMNLEAVAGDADGFATIGKINQIMVQFFKKNL